MEKSPLVFFQYLPPPWYVPALNFPWGEGRVPSEPAQDAKVGSRGWRSPSHSEDED